jgi:RNA polymerase sigma-70 factor (ECF subfamily)
MTAARHRPNAATAPSGGSAGTRARPPTFAPVIRRPAVRLTRTFANSDGMKEDLVELIPALRAFARALCRNPAEADDLVQETLTKALANVHRFEPGTRLKSWLFTIMRNSFWNRAAKLGREVSDSGELAVARRVSQPSQELALEVQDVRAAIGRLPRPQREAIVLVGVLGFSHDEAARVCGCAVGTIKSRLSRARSGLLEELGQAASAE